MSDFTNQNEETYNPETINTDMRIGIINISGNTGKTTVARHLLSPRMLDAEIISIETVNSDGKEDKAVRAEEFELVQRKMLDSISLIVDIGASNVEQTLALMRQMEGSHEDFDFFIIPVLKDHKQKTDSIRTVGELLKMGVDPEKIKIVFNKTEVHSSIETEFEDFLYAMDNYEVEVNTDASLKKSDFYPKFDAMNTTYKALLSVPLETNRKRQNELRRMRNRTPEEEAEFNSLVDLITLKRLAQSAVRNQDEVFVALFG